MLNAAIIGVGRWGRLLVDSVQGKSDLIRFTAGVTRTRAKAEDYCAKAGIDLRDSYDQILSDPDIDAVVLATPHTEHESQIIAAAKAGKHVFTEKPFTLDRPSAEAAVAACAKAGVALALGHNRRFMANVIELKRQIEAGELGTLMHAESNFSANLGFAAGQWRDSRAESPAGGMTSLGIHALDTLINLCGPITEVDARSQRRAIEIDIDDTTVMLFSFANGMTGYLGCMAATAWIWSLRVIGSKGWAEIPDNETLRICPLDGSVRDVPLDIKGDPGTLSLTAELEAFAAAATGGPPFPITPAEMINISAALAAISESAASGKRVAIG